MKETIKKLKKVGSKSAPKLSDVKMAPCGSQGSCQRC